MLPVAVGYQAGIENAWSNVATFLPKLVAALVIVLAAVVGSVIVAVGGGGIRTVQRYWGRAAGRAGSRGPGLRDQVCTSTYADTTP